MEWIWIKLSIKLKVDDNTVKITLTRPESPFLADMAMDFASILSAEYADQMLKAGQRKWT